MEQLEQVLADSTREDRLSDELEQTRARLAELEERQRSARTDDGAIERLGADVDGLRSAIERLRSAPAAAQSAAGGVADQATADALAEMLERARGLVAEVDARAARAEAAVQTAADHSAHAAEAADAARGAVQQQDAAVEEQTARLAELSTAVEERAASTGEAVATAHEAASAAVAHAGRSAEAEAAAGRTPAPRRAPPRTWAGASPRPRSWRTLPRTQAERAEAAVGSAEGHAAQAGDGRRRRAGTHIAR